MAKLTMGKKLLLGAFGAVGATGSALLYAVDSTVKAEGLNLHSPKLPWTHNKSPFHSYDINAVRRGYQVYKQVCSACHSMEYLHYRQLVDAVMTEDEAKAEAADVMVKDGPNDAGDFFERPGKLVDQFPSPYPNTEAAAAANNGAAPPDFSLIVKARENGENYIFHLLTGYCDPPAGVNLSEGQNFNPYFPGGVLAMASPLYDDIIEYDDGTPATQSQLAKDVVSFLTWAGAREHDFRKRAMIKMFVVVGTLTLACHYYKRHIWSPIKTRKLFYKPKHN